MSQRASIHLRLGAAYDDREAEFMLPAGWRANVATHRGAAPMTPGAIARSFARPVGAPPISEAARGARNAVILMDDFRRPTPAEDLSLQVIRELNAAGIPKECISVILGGGAHRTMTRPEAARRLGSVAGRVGRVLLHDAFSADVTFIGLTTAGTPVLINRIAVEADFVVSVSTVYPHIFTGWGGGAKMVLPGIAHVSSSTYNHTRISGGTWGCAPHLSPINSESHWV